MLHGGGEIDKIRLNHYKKHAITLGAREPPQAVRVPKCGKLLPTPELAH